MSNFTCPTNPVWSDIQKAFTAGDISCMKSKSQDWPGGVLDLNSYDSVYQYRDSINTAVNSGSMPENPTEKPWAPLACWNAWYANGCPQS